MKKKFKGSLTVEASILVPFIMFLLMALIYLLFFLHDCAIMQSFGIRTAEKALWQPDGEAVVVRQNDRDKVPLLMMRLSDVSCDTTDILSDLLELINSRKTAQIQVKGQTLFNLSGSTAFTGNMMDAEASVNAVKIHYTEDRLRSIFLQQQNGKKE